MADKREPEGTSVRNFRVIRGRADGDLLSNVAAGSIAQIVLATGAVLAFFYVAKLPLITLSVAILIVFILTPVTDRLEKWHMPRWAASFVALVLLVACVYGIIYFSYNQAVNFIDQLPRYSENIRETLQPFRRQAEKLQETTEAVIPNSTNRNAVPVKEQNDLSGWITSSFSGLSEVILSVSFIPFLVYFMLTWKDHARQATVRLFDEQNRQKVHVTLGDIAGMLRAFLVGNFVCGLFMALVSAIVFAFLRLPYFYFLGFISGFLSLIPYLGVVLAMLPPLAAGIGQLKGAQMIGIAIMVVGLHMFAINVLFPKVIGKRLKLNPLVVTISLLMWGWMWGAMGLILAVPISGALKIVFDHVESLRPLGAWMED